MLNIIFFYLLICQSLICQSTSKQYDLIEELTLENLNYVMVEGEIEPIMANEVILNMFDKEEEFYLYINSNGGDVESGLKIVKMMNYLQYNNITIICIAHKAFSMAFHIYQHCTERLLTQHTILMQHEMIVHINNNLENTQEQLNKFIRWNNIINTFDSKRLKMDKDVFITNLKKEIWLSGNDIILHNAGDRKIILK